MSPFCKSIHVNTATLLTWCRGILLVTRRILKSILFLTKSYTMTIEQSTRKYLKKLDLKIRSGNENYTGGGLSTSSYVTCHGCGQNDYIQRDYKSNRNVFDGNSCDKPIRYITEWVTTKTFVAYAGYLATLTITWNNKK